MDLIAFYESLKTHNYEDEFKPKNNGPFDLIHTETQLKVAKSDIRAEKVF